MGDRDRNHDEENGALDPEVLYTKEYCIGRAIGRREVALCGLNRLTGIMQVEEALARSTKGVCRLIVPIPSLSRPSVRPTFAPRRR